MKKIAESIIFFLKFAFLNKNLQKKKKVGIEILAIENFLLCMKDNAI